MTKVLLVSIASPPKSDPESLQVARYAKYLALAGCHIEILTSSDPTLYMEPDQSLVEYTYSVAKIYKVRLFEFKYLNSLINTFAPLLNQYPDSKWSFRFAKFSHIDRPDIIYSRSYPISSTLLALKLKRKYKVPWILHLSDPWAISYSGNSPATNLKPPARRWNLKKENECFSLADAISFTSEKTIELYAESYPQFSNKFILTRNVFDDKTVNNVKATFGSKLKIVCTSGFGEKRTPLFLLQAIAKFAKKRPELNDSIEFIFTGPITRGNRSIFASFYHLNQVTHLGVIPYERVLSLQCTAHILVNVDSNISEAKHSVFFPSKLLEYFAAGRRVLNISNNHSTSWGAIDKKFGDCAEFGDYQHVIELLENYWLRFKEQDESFFTLDTSINQFGAKHNAEKLLTKISQLAGTHF